MKNFIALIFLAISLILVGCNDETEPVEETKSTTNEIQETSKVEEGSKVESVEKVDSTLTRSEVDALFKQDPEETQYENGQLEFKYGEVVEVDYISYLGSDGIDYVSAMFFEDKLVDIQLDTTLSDEELEKILGIDIHEDLMINDLRDRGVYEITFNGKFRENAIARYPFEF